MLKLEHWSKAFGTNRVLDQVNLQVETGQVLTLIGPSGSGKSTLLRTINFLEPADQGLITLGDLRADAARVSQADILKLRRKTAMVFQNYALFSRKTALENVMEHLVTVKKLDKQIARQIAAAQLNRVGMSDRLDYYPRQLSGGQQQRVGIARALAVEPEVILLDEPSSSLDPERTTEILDLIRALAHDHMTMVLVTHEMGFAREVSDQVIFLDQGKILEQGPPETVFGHPKTQRLADFLAGYKNRQL